MRDLFMLYIRTYPSQAGMLLIDMCTHSWAGGVGDRGA